MMNSFFMAIWFVDYLDIFLFSLHLLYSCIFMMSPSEQAATLNLLAGLELAKKRHIVVQTHKSAGNKSDFYPAGVNVDPFSQEDHQHNIFRQFE